LFIESRSECLIQDKTIVEQDGRYMVSPRRHLCFGLVLFYRRLLGGGHGSRLKIAPMLDFLRVATRLLALGITTLVQLLVARTRLGQGLLRSFFAGFASLLALCAWVGLRSGTPWHEAAANTVANVATLWALTLCFFSSLNLPYFP
jgi:hypothetical protein